MDYSDLEIQMGRWHMSYQSCGNMTCPCGLALMKRESKLWTKYDHHSEKKLQQSSKIVAQATLPTTIQVCMVTASHVLLSGYKCTKCHFLQKQFVQLYPPNSYPIHGCPMLVLDCRYYTDAQLCQISGVYLLQFLTST